MNGIIDLTPDQNFVTPDYTKPYQPGPESLKFFSWVNLALGTEGAATPKTHYMMMDFIFEETELATEALCHRGFAKSTLITKYLPLYLASIGKFPNFGRCVHIPIFSASYTQATGLLKDMRAAWASSDFLQDTMRLAEDRNGRAVANKENHLCLMNEEGEWTHLKAFSSGEQIRGSKEPDEKGIGHRFELLLFDDILKDAILESEKEREKLKRWFFSSVMPAVNPKHHKEILIGTPMTDDELLSEFKRSPRVRTICFPQAMEMPVPVDEIVSSWPEWHTPKDIAASYADAKEAHAINDWYREKQLEVVNEEMRVFADGDMTDYYYESVKKRFPQMNFFTTIDMAVAKGSRDGKVAVITIGIDENSHWFIVRADNGYFTPTESIDLLFKHFNEYASLDMQAEKAALQQVLDHFLEKEMSRRAIWFNTGYLGANSSVSKENRVMALQPLVKRKMIHFPRDRSVEAINELKYQMRGFTKDGFTTKFKDLLDALANFTSTDFVFPPSQAMGSEVGSHEEYSEENFGY